MTNSPAELRAIAEDCDRWDPYTFVDMDVVAASLRELAAIKEAAGKVTERVVELAADAYYAQCASVGRRDRAAMRAALESVAGMLAHAGEITIATDRDGVCIAVTRQDEEYRILSVLWEVPTPEQAAAIRAKHDAIEVAIRGE